MPSGQALAHLTYAEYLALESGADLRHEFVSGEVYAMAGGTPEHGAVTAALARDLGEALRGRPCRVYSSDVRVRVRETGLATYPDLSVVCGRLETDAEDPDAILNPALLAEVLSPSTEAWDRGGKAAHYRRIPSLQELLLVSPAERRVELLRRSAGGIWELHEARPGDRLTLTSVGATLEISALFHDPLGAPPGASGVE